MLVSGGAPFSYYVETKTSKTINLFYSMTTIQITSAKTEGFKSDGITGGTSERISLDNYFRNNENGNCYKYYSGGLRGFSYGDLEEAYKTITGREISVGSMYKVSNILKNSELENVARENGIEWKSNWNNLLSTNCWLGGIYNKDKSPWSVSSYTVDGHLLGAKKNVRLVFRLKSGVFKSGGTGSFATPYTLSI